MATSQPTTPNDGVQTLKFKHGVVTNNQNPYKVGYDNGTIYFVEESASNDPRSYIYLNGKNIIPEMLDVRNGGLGADLSDAHPASVYIRSTGYATATIRTDAGAFYAEGQDGIPTFGTLPVDYGGTGITSITPGSLLYGGSNNTMNVLAAGTNGQIIVSDGAKPIYTSPSMQWTTSATPDTTGPRFDFKFNNEVFAGAEIPAATHAVSGIVTTGDQAFNGEKLFLSDIYTQNIYPQSTTLLSLGSSTAQWLKVYSLGFYGVDPANGQADIELSYNSTSEIAQLVLWGAKGNSIYLANPTGTGASRIVSAVQTSYQYDFNLPSYAGLAMVLSSHSQTKNTSTKTYNIPGLVVSTSQSHIEYVTGVQFQDLNGTTSAAGVSRLILGNNVSSGTANNKTGSIRLYGNKTYYTDLIPKANLTANYALTLPAASGELTWHTANARQGGPSNVDTPTDYALIKVETSGQIKADNTTNIASSDGEIMYLGNGALKKSAATIGSETVPVYLKAGTITECDAESVFSNFSSTPGTDAGEELSITVAGKNRTLTLDAATAAQSGVVTIEEQTFAGNKIFNGELTVEGTTWLNDELNVAGLAVFKSDVDVESGRLSFYDSADVTQYCTFEYDGSSDTLTLSFSS